MNGETKSKSFSIFLSKSIDNKSIKIYNKGTLNEKGMKNMKIKYLWLLNILDEMRSENLNNTIDKEFYDWTDYKSIDWLYENAETIVADFYDNIDKYKFEIKNRKDYFPITSRYLEFSNFKYDRRWMEEAIKEMKGSDSNEIRSWNVC